MRIAINGMFWSQPTVGSGQYLHGLLEALVHAAPHHHYALFIPAGQAATTPAYAHPALQTVTLATPFDRRSRNLAKLWFEQIAIPRAALRMRADVLHVPYFAPPRHARLPVVTSILDIIPLILAPYRGRASVRAYMRLVANAACRSAAILAISCATRDDIVRHLRIPSDRIFVSPLAAAAQYHERDGVAARAEVARRYGIDKPYIYYVGGFDARKNVPTLVRAFAHMRRSGGPPALLVIAGRALGSDSGLFPNIEQLIAELATADIRRIDVPAADNPLLYAAAEVFAYPSRYEGFGLGPLEAMACGTPVVVSHASSLPEVVGDAALRVPPDDIAGWTAALWRVLANPALRDDLRLRGLERAAQFSYDRTARITLQAYQRVA